MKRKKDTFKKRLMYGLCLVACLILCASWLMNRAGETQQEIGFLFGEGLESGVLNGCILCIDPGHGVYPESLQGPGNPEGTSGIHQTEEQLNLKVAKRLQEKLEDLGAIVYMTRTEAQTDMGNLERAEYANRLEADLCIKIHADSSEDPQMNGISVLVPGSSAYEDEAMMKNSMAAGKIILKELIETTQARNLGISVRTDLTGFYWSEIPVVLVEMGFMSNPEEDRLMETEAYQERLAQGMTNGIVRCLTKGV